jgi:Protein of unknown function (DUF2953)
MVSLLLLIVGLLILIAISLYFIPVIAHIALGKTPESGYLIIQASWGVIGASTRIEGSESRQEFLIGERPLYTRTVKDQKTRPTEVGESLRNIPSHIRRAHYVLQLIRPLSHLLSHLHRSMTLQEIRGNLMVGFRNPADTGIFYGWFSAIYPFLMVSRVCIDITPVFDRPVLEGEITAKVRIDRPLLLIIVMSRFFLDRDVRKALSGIRGG